MSNGGGKFKVTDRRATSGVLDSKGELASAVPRRMVNQEALMDKVAEHFKGKLERVEVTTVKEYGELLRAETEWAENLFREAAERHPEASLEVPARKQLTQLIGERAELLFIAEKLEARGLQRFCEDLVSRVKDGKNVSAEQYETFFNKFIAGEEAIEKILRDVPLTTGERAGIQAMLKEGEAKDIIELGRQFNAVKGYKYPAATIRAWAWKKAQSVAKANLADLFGGVSWAWTLATKDTSAKLGDHIARQYEKKHAKFTRKVSLLNIGKVTVAAAVVLGAGYLFSQCASCLFSGSEKEKREARKAVERKKMVPATPVEKELAKNQAFKRRTSRENKVPLWKSLASQLKGMKLSEPEQLNVAKMINKLPGQFVRGMKLNDTVELLTVLSKLSPRVSAQKLADTAVAIQMYVDAAQAKKFAKKLADTAKTAAEVDAFFESPPKGMKMTEEWWQRPFPEFTEKGFRADNMLRILSKEIRGASVKAGRETVPLTPESQSAVAAAMAGMYSGKGTPRIPHTYKEDLDFLLAMKTRKFPLGASTRMLSQMRQVYMPEHLDAAFQKILPKLKPTMSEGEMRAVIESVAFRNRGMTTIAWNSSPDARLSMLNTNDAKNISTQLRKHPQQYYEGAMDTLVEFIDIWQGEVGVFSGRNFTEVQAHLNSLARSKALGHLSPKEKAQVLYRAVTSVKPKSRAEVLKHLEKAFAGKKPAAAEVLAEIGAYVAENPKLAP